MDTAAVPTVSLWLIADSVVAFILSLVTTGFLVFLVWRVVNRLLSGFLGKNIGFYGALFASIIVGVTGVKVAADFLSESHKIPILNGVVMGITGTVNACITPKHFSPLEFLIMVGLMLYVCYWLHTRFPQKNSIDDIREKFERTVDPDAPPKSNYPY